MLYIMLAAAYPFGRPEDENLKPSRKMHVMLQVSLSLGCVCPLPAICESCLSNDLPLHPASDSCNRAHTCQLVMAYALTRSVLHPSAAMLCSK